MIDFNPMLREQGRLIDEPRSPMDDVLAALREQVKAAERHARACVTKRPGCAMGMAWGRLDAARDALHRVQAILNNQH